MSHNKKSRKQHNGELQGTENSDVEGDVSEFKDVVKNKTDITARVTMDEEHDPGFV